MYGNNVIKYFKRALKNVSKDFYTLEDENMELLIKHIGDSQHFHMGTDKISEIASKMWYGKGVPAFMGDLATDVMLPYDKCWFDYCDTSSLGDESGDIAFKIGMFVGNPDIDKDTVDAPCMSVMPCISIPHEQFDRHLHGGRQNLYLSKWFLGPTCYYIKVGKFWTYNEARDIWHRVLSLKTPPEDMNEKILHEQALHATKGNIIQIPLITPQSGITYKFASKVGEQLCEHAVIVLNMFLMVLGCKNVVTETVVPKRKVGKKIKPNKKKFQYKILKVNIPKSRKNYIGTIKTDRKVSLHLCRGHFKVYTEESPLFGKIVGRFWWQSQIRGNENQGTVFKDYTANYTEKEPE